MKLRRLLSILLFLIIFSENTINLMAIENVLEDISEHVLSDGAVKLYDYEKDDTVKWSLKLGNNNESGTGPIVVNEYVYTSFGDTIYKIDLEGNIVNKAKLYKDTGYNYFISYGEGRIFIQLKNGQVQAFDEDTLESIWISDIPLSSSKGQGLCPLTYYDGFIYGGTVVTYGGQGCYYCIDDKGNFVWQFYPEKDGQYSGFYWCKSAVIGNYVIFGSEGGLLYYLNRFTGERIESFQAEGNIRCGILVKDKDIYFTDKKGYAYKLKVNNNGKFYDSIKVKISQEAIESTSTPVFYKGRIYICAFTDSNGVMSVFDEYMNLIYSSYTKEKIKTTPIAVSANDGNIYVFVSCYDYPGTVVRFKEDRKNNMLDYEKVYIPYDKTAQYCVNSLYYYDGVIYYINDSSFLTALNAYGTYLPSSPTIGSSGGSDNDVSDNITVYFELNTSKFSIKKSSYNISGNSYVCDLFTKVLDMKGYTYEGAENGYISSITSNNGITLSEFQKGANSGFMYKLNGENVELGIKDCKLSDGDYVYWYYTNDYTNSSSDIYSDEESNTEITTQYFYEDNIDTIDFFENDYKNDGVKENGFSDISNSSYKDDINFLMSKNILKGTEEGLFEPDKYITRAEFAVAIYRIGKIKGLKKDVFNDVYKNSWFYEPAAGLYDLEIIKGMENSSFMPDKYITRQEMAVIADRFIKHMDIKNVYVYGETDFKDEYLISEYAKESVHNMFRCDIINCKNLFFNPLDNVKRDEAGKYLYKIYKLLFQAETY